MTVASVLALPALPAAAASAPTVTSLSPSTGSSGTAVVLTGTNFTGATEVEFGSVPTAYEVVSATEIIADASGVDGSTVNVTVTTPGGQSAAVSANSFTFLAYPSGQTPGVYSLDPPDGSAGTSVTLTGYGFSGATAVDFGGAAASFKVLDDEQITATAPAGTLGASVLVTVVVPAGSSTSNGVVFSYHTVTTTTQPTLYEAFPDVAPTTGQLPVDIFGTGMAGVTAVHFGTAVATFQVLSDSEIAAVAPAGAVGSVDITLTSNGGTSPVTATDAFSYETPPAVSSVTPSSGSVGASVTITGTGFTSLPPYFETGYYGYLPGQDYGCLVLFGSTCASSDHILSATQIVATAPSGPPSGPVDVRVATADGQSAVSAGDVFTYKAMAGAPVVTSVSPSDGPLAAGSDVYITGQGFTGTTAVAFGSTQAKSFTVENDQTIEAVDPAGAAGTVDVKVTNGTGTSSAVVADHFTYLGPPTVTSLSPKTGPQEGGTRVTVDGTGFTDAYNVEVGTTTVSDLDVISSTQLTFVTPAGASGASPVTVTTIGGISATTSADLFTYATLAPGILSISPSSGPVAGGTTVAISGTGFSSTSTVAIGGVAATSVTYQGPNSLSAVVPAGTAGSSVAVTVKSGGKTSATSPVDLYTYLARPTVTGVSPATGPSGGGNVVTITGTGFSGVTSVQFGATAVYDEDYGSIEVNTTNSLTVEVPAGSVGTVDVTVVTGGGTSATSSSDHYAYTESAPVITGLSPSSGSVAGGGEVVISGFGFIGATEVEFGTTPVHFTAESATEISTTAPPGSAGTVSLTVTGPSGGSPATLADEYTYLAAPTVTGLSATTGPPAGGNTIIITGSGFSSCMQGGNDVCTVQFGSGDSPYESTSSVDPLAVLSSSQMSVQVPAGAGGSTVAIRVVSPVGTSPLSSSDQYAYTAASAPTVTEVYSASGPAGTTVDVVGTGFTTASQVLFGSVPATSFQPVSDSYLYAVVPAGTGTVDVTVTNPVGTSAVTSTDRFTYTSVPTGSPTITAVSPSSGPETGGTVVKITGTNLDTFGSYGTDVSFGGSDGTVESESATSIEVLAPSAPAGKVNITVGNYYEGTSSAITSADQFTFKGVAPSVHAVEPNSGSTSGGTLVEIEGSGLFGVTGVSFGSTKAAVYLPEEGGTITEAVSPAHAAGATDVTVGNTVGTSEVTPSDQFTFSKVAAPTITAVSPSSGSTSGGTVVTITGTGFQSVNQVMFGAFVAASFEVNSATSITALSPAEGTGVVDISVSGPQGTSASIASDHFSYTGSTPAVTAITPSSGPTGGNTLVIINGLNLAGTTAVHFGTVSAPVFQLVPDLGNGGWEVDAVAPPGSAGTQNVSVTTPNGTSAAVAASSYTYLAAPVVTSVSPSSGPVTGGTAVTVTGTNLANAVSATVGGSWATIDSNSATSLTLTTPGQSATGTYDIQVTTAGGTSPAVAADSFTYTAVEAAPSISEVNPSIGPLTGGNDVSIWGADLSGVTTVNFGSVPATILTHGSGLVEVVAPAESAGVVNIVVTTSGGTSAISGADEYTYSAAPTVTAVNPDSGPTVGGTTVTITGTGFSTSSSYDVEFGTMVVNGEATSPTTMTAEAPAQPGGVVDIVVTGPNGTSATNSADRFTYKAPRPTVTAVDPSIGPTTGGTEVSITGTGFTGTTAVAFGSTAASSFTVWSDTSMVAYSPVGSAGVVNVVVTTAGGSSAKVAADDFTYAVPTPVVSGISPSFGTVSGGTSVTVYGSGFTGATKVAFGNVAASTFAVQDDGELTVKSPAQAASVQDILVTTPGGTSTAVAEDEFTYGKASATVPTVTGISPATGSTEGGTQVTITGTNLTGATSVQFGSVGASVVTVVSATEITAESPAQGPFVVDVIVTTPTGTSAPVAADKFTYTPGTPTVSYIYATEGSTAGGTSVSIEGAQFYGLTGVEFGTTMATVTYLSPDDVAVVAPAHAAGAVDITILTSHGSSTQSSADQFTYITPPTITKVSPSSGPDSGGTSVTLTGTGLGSVDTVYFGTDAVYSYEFSSQSATAITVASPPQAPGSVEITASISGVSSTASTSEEFTYKAVVPTITGISPSSGPTTAGQDVTVEGTGLFALTAVDFGSTAATITDYSGDGTAVYVTAPAGSTGTVNVTAADSAGTSTTSAADDYTYVAAPTVTKVSPATGPTTGGTAVKITGTNLANATAVDFGSTEVESYEFTADTATSITVPSPSAGPGEVDVTVVTAGGTSATSTADEFTFDLVAPAVSGIYPSSGGSGTSVEVEGSNMYDVSAVDFGTVAGTVTYVDPGGTYLEVTAPAGTGTVDITVTNTAGTSPVVSADQFTYITPPTITKVSPSSGPDSGGTSVTLTGTGLGSVDTVYFGTDAVYSYEFSSQSATAITVASPPQAPGSVEITASISGVSSTASTSEEFTYKAVVPTITGISPSSGPTTAGQDVTVEGTGLFALTAVDFGSTAATITDYSGDGTAVYVTAPAGSTGTVNVTAADSAGTSTTSAADDYTYVAAPTVTKVSPATGPTTGGTAVKITGTNLANATAVDFGSTEVESYEFTADTATSITVPSPSAGPGEVDVTVVTAGGTSATSTADEFTFDLVAPAVSGIYPSSGGSGTSVEVEGSNMYDVSAVDFGTVAGTVTYVDPGGTYLEVTAPAGTGTVDITVTNTAGTSPVVSADQFTYS